MWLFKPRYVHYTSNYYLLCVKLYSGLTVQNFHQPGCCWSTVSSWRAWARALSRLRGSDRSSCYLSDKDVSATTAKRRRRIIFIVQLFEIIPSAKRNETSTAYLHEIISINGFPAAAISEGTLPASGPDFVSFHSDPRVLGHKDRVLDWDW